MIGPACALVAVALWAVLALPALGAPEESVVGLYVSRGSGRADLGTGFFTSEGGQILTAYHVVVGATGIKAVDARKNIYPNVRVDLVAPNRDLAILQIESPQDPTPYLRLSNRVPPPSETLTVIGYPRGLSHQHITARTTSLLFVSSFELRAPGGARLFRERIDVVGVDATSYSGMSGAPLLSRGEVVGVFSGSFNEGGSIAWAIPVKYVDEASPLGRRPAAITAWPPFTLMTDSFRSLHRPFRVNETGERMLVAYLDSVGAVSSASNQLILSSNKLMAAFLVVRPMLETARADPTLSNDFDALFELLEFPIEQMNEKLKAWGEANTKFGEASYGFGTSLLDLSSWYEQETEVTARERYILDQRIQHLAQQKSPAYSDLIGADEEAVIQAAIRLTTSLTLMGKGDSSKAQDFLDTWSTLVSDLEPEVRKHTSMQAITKLHRDVGYYRQLASLFEPVVYRGIDGE